MTRIISSVLAAVFLATLTACEFESSGSDSSFNSDVAVNVSGAYKDADGGFLVKQPGSSTSTVKTEQLGTGDGVKATYAGTLSSRPLKAGSVSVTDGTETFTDPNASGVLTGDRGGTGSIAYDTGTYSVNFFLPPGANQPVMATYSYYPPGTLQNPQQGNSGAPIYTFNVRQTGDNIEVVDDHGDSYQGRMDDPYTEFDTGIPNATRAQQEGRVGATNPQRQVGLSYPFEIEGTSNGNPIRISGQFKSEVTIVFAIRQVVGAEGGVGTTLEELFRRNSTRMVATWVETATGTSAAINAVGASDLGAVVLDPNQGVGPITGN